MDVPFAVQIVVTGELEPKNHASLRVLSRNAKRFDIERFLEKTGELTEPGDRDNIDAVLKVSVAANHEVYDSIRKEDPEMCEALRELMKDEIEEAVNAAVNAAVSAAVSEAVYENTTSVELNSIKSIMETLNFTADEAMDVLKVPQEKRVVFLARL